VDTTITTSDGTIDGYLAVPQPEVSGPPPWPGVVVVHDMLGMSDDVRTIAERFATAGYVAMVPNLYSRGGFARCVRTTFRELLAGSGRAHDDIDAARGALTGRDDCTGKAGIAGFCMGGGFALLAATRDFDASAPYYGQLPADTSILDGACPIVASFGGRDRVPDMKGAAGRLDQVLTGYGVPHDVKEYADAGHSFANRMAGPLNALLRVGGMAYHHESSEDAWRRVMSFFAEHLGRA
jgi:carboxymethylenebutenolidase